MNIIINLELKLHIIYLLTKNTIDFTHRVQFVVIGFQILDLTQANFIQVYNQKSYEDHQATFNNIINLKKNKSDNYHRCKELKILLKKHFKNCNILDVGSGLGVFPYSMNKVGIRCDAVDPDITMVKHMKKNLKNFSNKIFYANFLKFKNKKKYNIITLNKVLEHVENPYKFLSKTKIFKNRWLFIY